MRLWRGYAPYLIGAMTDMHQDGQDQTLNGFDANHRVTGQDILHLTPVPRYGVLGVSRKLLLDKLRKQLGCNGPEPPSFKMTKR